MHNLGNAVIKLLFSFKTLCMLLIIHRVIGMALILVTTYFMYHYPFVYFPSIIGIQGGSKTQQVVYLPYLLALHFFHCRYRSLILRIDF